MLLADIPAIAEATFLVVAALFPIVNPLGSAAIFLNLVGTLDPQLNRVLAQKIAIYSFFILIVSLICGTEILSFFGISIYAVQIGGGLIVTVTGWTLLNRPTGSQTPAGKVTPHDVLGNAFYPYTLPITVGPGFDLRRCYVGCASDGLAEGALDPVAIGAHFGANGHHSDLRHHLHLLSLRQRRRKGARGHRNRGVYAAVFVHSGVHRYSDHLFGGAGVSGYGPGLRSD